MSKQEFPSVYCMYGAPMGRAEVHNDFSGRARCFKVKLFEGYDDGSAYWGNGIPLYCATNGEGFMMFTRQPNRKLAKIEFQKRASAICGNKKGNTISWIN